MIDLIALAGLFGEVFGAAKNWTEPKVAEIEPLSAIEQEPVFQRLKKEGHEFVWVRETRLRQLKREGWKPVVERDALLRPTIFTDRLQELVLVHRNPAE